MVLTLPDQDALRDLSEAELKQELAVGLYAATKLTLVQAADLAGVGFFEFQKLLRDRRVPQHYGDEGLNADLSALNELFPA